MKIAMILDADFPPDLRVENEARRLSECGHELYLFSLSFKQFENKIEDLGFLKLHRYKASRLIYKLSALAYTFPFYRWLIQRKIRNFLELINPDAIHVHDMVIAKSVLRISKKYGKVLVLDLHENRPEIMKFYPHTQSILGKMFINLNKWNRAQMDLIEAYNHIVVVTEEARDYYVKTTSRTINDFSVVPNTSDIRQFVETKANSIQSSSENHFVLLYIGNTGIRRGTLFVIEALPLLIQEIQNIKLVLVGDSSEDSYLKARAQELGVSHFIEFKGWQEPKLLPDFISNADVCLSPLQRNQHHDTTFANKIFQYMSIGKPLLVSDCPPQKRIVLENKCGLVYGAENMEDYVQCVLKLFLSEETRTEMGQKGRNAVKEKLNFKATSAELVRFYSTL